VDLTLARSPLLAREDFLVVELDRFQGPLDLLLHLIRQQDVDIFDIPIARITDHFLAAIQGIRADQLEGAGEFLEMAATLIRIKAQMLLPRHEGEEDQDPRAELVRRLLEYEQIREISTRLQSAEAARARRFGKGYVPARPRPEPSDTPLETTWDEVMGAAMRVELPESFDRRHSVTPRTVAMEDKVALIAQRLGQVTRIEFSRLLAGFEDKIHGVMTLLAGLELSRRRELFLRQVAPFSELWLYRRGEDDAVPPVEGAETAPEEPEFPRGVRRRPAWMKPEEPEVDDPLAALDEKAEAEQRATAVTAHGGGDPTEGETT
jgi:segregation and condensation protein A